MGERRSCYVGQEPFAIELCLSQLAGSSNDRGLRRTAFGHLQPVAACCLWPLERQFGSQQKSFARMARTNVDSFFAGMFMLAT